MKKIFTLFAAVLMAGSMMAEDGWIKFSEVQPATEVAGSTYGDNGFTLVIPTESDKATVDASSCTFGLSAEETVTFTHRLKTGGASSKDGRKFTLNIPEEGPLAIYVRTSSKDATDRSFLIANGSDTIVYHVCLDTDTVEGASSKIFLPVIVENVPAGSYTITYNNAINFYGFQMGLEEEDTPVTLGTFSISSAEINSGKVGEIALGNNTYGSQAVDNPATWYTCAKGDYTFKGAKICMAAANNGGGLQMQGNASDVAKMGFFGNVTAFNNIHSVKVVLRTASTSTYAPVFNLYTDSLGTTNAIASADTVQTTEGGYKKFVYTYTYAEPGKFFNIKDDLAGALYIDTIYVNYEKEEEEIVKTCPKAIFSVAEGATVDNTEVESINVNFSLPEGMEAGAPIYIEGMLTNGDDVNSPFMASTDFSDGVDVKIDKLAEGDYTINVTFIGYGFQDIDLNTFTPFYEYEFKAEEGQALASLNFTIEVKNCPEEGHLFTIAEAKEAYDNECIKKNDSISLTGYISNMFLKPNNFSKYGSVCVWLTDTLGGSAKEFELYNCYGFMGDTLVSYAVKEGVEVGDGSKNIDVASVTGRNGMIYRIGDLIEAAGTITLYNGTYELNTGCYLTTEGEKTITAVENTKSKKSAQKVVENGQVVILRDGKKFSLMGTEL